MTDLFEDARQALLAECDKLMKIRFSELTLSFGIWPEALHEKSISDTISDFDSKHFTSDGEHRDAIRRISSQHFQVFFSILSRLQLMQISCSKIANSWSGVSSDINEFRYLLERYVALIDLLNKFETDTGSSIVRNLNDLDDLASLVGNSGWTRFNWSNQENLTFEDMKGTTYRHAEDSEKPDLTSTNIMNLIDRVEKSDMKGLRAYYSFCCEFVHSNLGDAISCGFDSVLLPAKDGKNLLRYTLSPLSKPHVGEGVHTATAERYLIGSAYLFSAKILCDLNARIPSLLKLNDQIKSINKKWIHKIVKRTEFFEKNDLCPCGSGRSIKACITRTTYLKAVR